MAILKKENILVILITLLAAFLILFGSFSVPPSLNWDEASIGYNAYSVLKTGHDEWGRFLPLTFEAFGDYKLPGYIYADIPFIAIFGLNETGVRLPSYLSGILAMILFFGIVKNLANNSKLALISAFLLAISPWHFFFSRMALEANLAFSLFLAGLYFFTRSFKNTKYLFLTSLFLGLTLFTYNSARLFIPLFCLGLLVLFKDFFIKNKSKLFWPAAIFIVFVMIAGFLALREDSSSRYYWVSIVDQGAINFLNEQRGNSALPDFVTKLIYNRYVYFGQVFVKNYLSYFSLEFLFLKGGSNYQFSIPNNGLLYLIELPFLLFGIFKILKNKPLGYLALLWLLLAPIPASVTREAPHALRAIFMIGSLQIIAAIGILESLNLASKFNFWIRKGMLGLGAIILIFSSLFYFYLYFNIYPRQYSQSWQYGMDQVIQVVLDYQKQYPQNNVYLTKRYGEPHIFYLFFSQYPPARYQSNPSLIRYARTNWRWVDRLDNIYFLNDWEIQEKLASTKNSLLITSPGVYPPEGKLLNSIYFLDGQKAFDIVSL